MSRGWSGLRWKIGIWGVLIVCLIIRCRCGGVFQTQGTFRTDNLIVDTSATINGLSVPGMIVTSTQGPATNGAIKVYNGDPNGVVSAAKGSILFDTATPSLYQNSDGAMVWIHPGGSVSNIAVFSDGHDGPLHFDGVTTLVVEGASIAPGTVDGVAQTYQLPIDIFPSTLTIDAGVQVISHNFRVYGQVGVINGHLDNDGRPGVGRGGGAATQTGVYPSSNGGGGAGANGDGAGNPGSQSQDTLYTWPVTADCAAQANGSNFGQGGGGGTAGGRAGGTGGAINNGGLVTYNVGGLTYQMRVSGRSVDYGSAIKTGSGGGGGGVNGGSSQGGGGGAGGSWAYYAIGVISGSGVISCDGGKGANASFVDTPGGGGAGGGGGVLNLDYNTKSGVTVRAIGGIGGTGVSGGGTGGNGSPGTTSLYNYSGDGT